MRRNLTPAPAHAVKKSHSIRRSGDSANCSDRLRMLSLPNSHLVEAVLKQHSHVFNEGCRDRLRNILQRRQRVGIMERDNRMPSMVPVWRPKLPSIERRRLPDPLEDIEEVQEPDDSESISRRRRRCRRCEAETQAEPREFISSCSVALQVSKSLEETDLNNELNVLRMMSKYKRFREEQEHDLHHQPSRSNLKSVAACYRMELVRNGEDETVGNVGNDRRKTNNSLDEESAEGPLSACGDRDLSVSAIVSDVEVLSQLSAVIITSPSADQLEPAGEAGDCSIKSNQSNQSAKPTKDTDSPKSMEEKPKKSKAKAVVKTNIPGRHRQKEPKMPSTPKVDLLALKQKRPAAIGGQARAEAIKKPPTRKSFEAGMPPSSIINVPSLAVRAYIILVVDMQRNCELYPSFRALMITPIEKYKEPYMTAAYKCWMDYMNYVEHTLDCLHPYIMDLVRACYSRGDQSAQKRRCNGYHTKIPKMLIHGLQHMKTWRKALAETIHCCDVVRKKDQKDLVEKRHAEMLQIYDRYFKKLSECQRSKQCTTKTKTIKKKSTNISAANKCIQNPKSKKI